MLTDAQLDLIISKIDKRELSRIPNNLRRFVDSLNYGDTLDRHKEKVKKLKASKIIYFEKHWVRWVLNRSYLKKKGVIEF